MEPIITQRSITLSHPGDGIIFNKVSNSGNQQIDLMYIITSDGNILAYEVNGQHITPEQFIILHNLQDTYKY